MKNRVFICLFFMISIKSFCQEDAIERMNNKIEFLKIKNGKSKSTICIQNQDTIFGIMLSEHRYIFCSGDTLIIEAKLYRKWNVLNPLWNTFIFSDKISMIPIGKIMFFLKGDTVSCSGYKNAYVGPKFLIQN